MKIARRTGQLAMSAQTEPDRFSGSARFVLLHALRGLPESNPDAATELDGGRGAGTWATHPGNVAIVRYEPDARSFWHSHSGGQFLYIIEGAGWVQVRGASTEQIEAGDAVSFEPGEQHWHGAGPKGMAHLTVTVGRPTWYEEPEQPAPGR